MKNKVLKYILRTLLVIVVTLLLLFGIVYLTVYKIANGPSKSAKEVFVSTILESGQLKFVASWVCSKEEIQEIVDRNTMKKMNTDIDESLIHIANDENKSERPSGNDDPGETEEVFDENGIRIVEVSGPFYYGKMMIIKDPAQVVTGTSRVNGQWQTYGKDLEYLVKDNGAVAGVNGGIYVSKGNKGGSPLGVVVEHGEICFNSPTGLAGLYMIGFDNNNLLVIKDISGMSAAAFKDYVAEAGIRDAVAFQEENTDANNHFVPLVINGEGRELNGQGSGYNPRTAIGQRADGAILLLVCDGRGASGHMGASAADLIGKMLEFGAVNAANLDGGSSSTMYYNNHYEMTSVTFYYANGSWKLPTSFVVMPKSN